MPSPAAPEDWRRTAVGKKRPGIWRSVPFVAYFLLFAAWALAMPYNGSPDEAAHIWRAYGAASGDVAPALAEKGAVQDVPRSLPPDACFAGRAYVPANCGGREPGGDETLTAVDTPAGRYNPLFYLAVGWPLVISPDMAGVIVARLVNAALVAGLFGWATLVAVSLRRRGATAGLIVALTPMTAHLAGAVNPNAIEIAAGVGLVTALIAILFEPDTAGSVRSAWWLAGTSGAVMLNVRAAGPIWFAIIVAIMLVPLGRRRYVALARSNRTWWLVDTWAVTGLAGGAWTLWKRSYEIVPSPPTRTLSMEDALKIEVVRRFPKFADQMIGVMGWLDTPLPIAVYLAWWLTTGTLAMLALAVGRPADRWRVLGLAGLGLAVPVLIEVVNVNQYGFISQGRYFLPMLVGVPILAGYLLGERVPFDLTPRLTKLFVVILLPAQVSSLCYTMIRYQRGMFVSRPPSLNPVGGAWQPAIGSVLPIAIAVGAAVLFILFYYRIGARSAVDVPADDDRHSPASVEPDLSA
ncbi:Uncharacterized membrane protein [Micromonospora inositola]|uniref:Uncharacterized membrane protein n=2 Tax=Micromonospora inositola TaxID=47865 RepID=A0A1C5GYB9_9ACTN|nr:Uncharacterized membrane protein [Micromonospora inositola]